MAKRRYYRRVFQKTKKNNLVIFVLKLGGAVLFTALLAAAFIIFKYLKDLPRPENFAEKETIQSTKIYDREGKILLYEIYDEEKRTIVALDKISPYLKKAIVAAEDADFYQHHGISLKAIARAVLADLKIMELAQGGSTISQQLVRSSYLGREKTGVRKTREIVLALELERRYSKDQILEFYLNQIPFGENTYGAQTASQTYFNKNADSLSLPEAAILASLVKAPSLLSPYGSYKDALLARKDYVISRMEELKMITPQEAKSAKEEVLKFAKISRPIKAPHFTLWIKQLLEQEYGESFLKEKGLKIYTSLDWKLQEIAEKTIEEKSKINQAFNAFNAALVAMDPKTGEILAMVGSKNFFGESFPKNCDSGKNCLFESQFNVALAPRQPGSAFKPFVYATAFKKGFDDKTVVVDELTNFGVWGGKEYIPRNYDGLFRGTVTLRQSLAQSLNIPSVKVLVSLAGLQESAQTAKDLGITTLNPPFGPSMVLGGQEVKLLEIVSAYSVFANNGLWLKPRPIIKIEDNNGQILEETKILSKKVLETKVAALINNILSDNNARSPIFGFHSPLFFEGFQVAAKTGTTQDFKDGWAIGYTPLIAIGVWAGNNDNSSMTKEPGVVSAGPIFHEVMLKTLTDFSKGKESFTSNP